MFLLSKTHTYILGYQDIFAFFCMLMTCQHWLYSWFFCGGKVCVSYNLRVDDMLSQALERFTYIHIGGENYGFFSKTAKALKNNVAWGKPGDYQLYITVEPRAGRPNIQLNFTRRMHLRQLPAPAPRRCRSNGRTSLLLASLSLTRAA